MWIHYNFRPSFVFFFAGKQTLDRNLIFQAALDAKTRACRHRKHKLARLTSHSRGGALDFELDLAIMQLLHGARNAGAES